MGAPSGWRMIAAAKFVTVMVADWAGSSRDVTDIVTAAESACRPHTLGAS